MLPSFSDYEIETRTLPAFLRPPEGRLIGYAGVDRGKSEIVMEAAALTLPPGARCVRGAAVRERVACRACRLSYAYMCLWGVWA